MLKDVDAAVQAIEPKPAQAPVFSRADDGAYEGMFPSKEAADTWAFDNRDKLTGVTRVSSDGKHYVRARFKDEVNETPIPLAVEEPPPAQAPVVEEPQLSDQDALAQVIEDEKAKADQRENKRLLNEVIADERTKAEQREAPTVEPVSAEEAPEPVVEEPTTVPVAEPEPVVEEPTPPVTVTCVA